MVRPQLPQLLMPSRTGKGFWRKWPQKPGLLWPVRFPVLEPFFRLNLCFNWSWFHHPDPKRHGRIEPIYHSSSYGSWETSFESWCGAQIFFFSSEFGNGTSFVRPLIPLDLKERAISSLSRERKKKIWKTFVLQSDFHPLWTSLHSFSFSG